MEKRITFEWEDNIKLSLYFNGEIKIELDETNEFWKTQSMVIEFYGKYMRMGDDDTVPIFSTYVPIEDGFTGLKYGKKILIEWLKDYKENYEIK